jgi:endoglucanase
VRSLSRLAAITAGLVTALSIMPAAPAAAATELVVNGAFAAGTAPWWNSANTTMAVDAGRLRVNVTGGTSNPWDAMVAQNDITLTAGRTYTLSFDAWASATVSAVTTVQLADSPYTNTLTKPLALTTASRRFSFPFTAGFHTWRGQVSFQLGKNAAHTFYLDNVSLVETTPGSPAPGPIAQTKGFFVSDDSNPRNWVKANPGGTADRIQAAIASKPIARWFGNWNADIARDVDAYLDAAQAAGGLATLVAYNIPGRDACGGHSNGGAAAEQAYKAWISRFAGAIGDRPALVIIEPDSLGDFQCMPLDHQQERTRMLVHATQEFRAKAPNAWAYLDAGNAGWTQPAEMAGRLRGAGIADAHGFSVNVSNYYTTDESTRYADAVNAALPTATSYVIDTSRNTNGSAGGANWCNPAGRKLGTPAQLGGGAEMLLWVKVPGDSDGPCGIGGNTTAGHFYPHLATSLIDGA